MGGGTVRTGRGVKVREDKGGVERDQQGGHGGEGGESLVLKTTLEVVEDMKVDEALLYEYPSLLFLFLHLEVARGAGHCSLVGGDVGEASEALEWSSR